MILGRQRSLIALPTPDSKTILVVEDEKSMRHYLSAVLHSEGYRCEPVGEALAALSRLSVTERPVDLVLSDINMPGLDGIEFLRTVKTVSPDLPVILVSGLYELTLALDALKSGAADYLYKPVKPKQLLDMVAKHLRPEPSNDHAALQKALGNYLAGEERGGLSTDQVLKTFETLGLRRYETLQHSRRVAEYSHLVGVEAKFGEAELNDLRLGALLHDIGKIAIPHNVLMKPGPLDDEEWAVMRLHPRIGWELLSPFEELAEASEIVHCHHEVFNGKGYPKGLSGEDIPAGARVFSFVDTLDAIVSDRPYRAGRPVRVAREIINSESGAQFDPYLVEAFGRVPDESLEQIRSRYPDE